MDDLNEAKNEATGIELSVVIPVLDDEAVLANLFDRLYPVLDGLGIAYEAVFVDAGSRDRSATLLRQQYKLRPDVTRILLLRGNAGRHTAILAGFEISSGDRVVTLDADPQNSPAAIPQLLAELDRGHDCVGGFRRRHQGWRAPVSRAMNRLSGRITQVRMTDPGSLLCACDHELVDVILTVGEVHALIPPLAYRYAADPVEIEVEHSPPAAGEAKYPLYETIRLDLELLTGFSLVPLRLFSLASIGLSLASFILAVLLAVRRLVVGSEVEGVFTLFGVLFFLVGMILFGIGLSGQYLQRLCEQPRGRPRYLVREHLCPRSGPTDLG